MITFNEMLGRHLITDVPINIQQNMQELQQRMNVLRLCYGDAMIVTRCYSTVQEQLKINPAAPNSLHITGQAIDIADPDGLLAAWCKIPDHKFIFEVCGLWLEDPAYTPDHAHVHFQSRPPRSGNRIFKP